MTEQSMLQAAFPDDALERVRALHQLPSPAASTLISGKPFGRPVSEDDFRLFSWNDEAVEIALSTTGRGDRSIRFLVFAFLRHAGWKPKARRAHQDGRPRMSFWNAPHDPSIWLEAVFVPMQEADAMRVDLEVGSDRATVHVSDIWTYVRPIWGQRAFQLVIENEIDLPDAAFVLADALLETREMHRWLAVWMSVGLDDDAWTRELEKIL
jgi:hypothetical protein